MFMFLLIVLCVVYVIRDTQRIRRSRIYKVFCQYPPCLKELPIIGCNYHFLLRSPEDAINKAMEVGRNTIKQGEIARIYGYKTFYLAITDAPDIAETLTKCLNKDKYSIVLAYTGNGSVFVADSSISKVRRRVIMPAFNSKMMSSYIEGIWAESVALTEELKPFVGKGPFTAGARLGAFCFNSVIMVYGLVMKIVPIFKIMTVSTIIRVMKNTSPKSGCIQLLVHVFFGTIIVTSFIMILMMTLRGDGSKSDEMSSKCSVSKCRVMCTDIDLVNDDTSQITIAASDADTNCESIALAMIRPIFRDGILPENWLARVRKTIRELSIVEGNLKHITPGSFMDPASNGIQMLVLDGIEISTWREDTFLGLSNLREIYLKDCSFGRIKENALEAVDNTLALLDIKALHFWNPVNVTGSSTFLKLEKVNLSFNIFYDILSSVTFQSLHYCKILYLNSCKITFIGAGTFEPMKSLELLYLNDNHLVTIPSGLFEPFLTSQTIRIALHENFWLCSCSQTDLRTLHTNGAIMVEPTCYYPDIKRGITFSELEEYCEKRELNKPITLPEHQMDMCKKLSISTIIQNTAACYEDNLSFQNNGGRYVMPTIHHTCLSNRMKVNVYKQIQSVKTFVTHEEFSENSTWLRPVYTSHSMQFSMIELSVTGKSNDGVMWFESDNKSDIYCINSVPDVLQVFYSSLEEDYTFCLFDTRSGNIHIDKCLKYKLSDFEEVPNRRITIILKFLIHMCTAFACLLCGATCVFVIINKNPTLLKRNKRILLVKHKTIDALVLPPEVPLRKDNMADANDVMEKIFVLPQNELHPQSCYERSTSMRSSESNDASYISALSPTEEQLRDWRSNSLVFDRSSTDGDASPICSLYESLPYYSLHEKVYESMH